MTTEEVTVSGVVDEIDGAARRKAGLAMKVARHSDAFERSLETFPKIVVSHLPHEIARGAQRRGCRRAIGPAAPDGFKNGSEGSFAVLEEIIAGRKRRSL